jgi:hypothetical protein
MTCFLAPIGKTRTRALQNLRIIVSRAMEAHRKLGQPPALNRAGQRCYTAAFVKFVRKTP